ncbi:MAG TPA: DinB family protein [Vicinamibacterales bacterium]|nr:DinB family protein [Vicinamibacterales bacterium]
MLAPELASLFTRDISRLIQELHAFPDTASVWKTAPGVTNAAGTLALHLEGNLREYIGRQLGQIAFTRNRPLEFSDRGVDRAVLIAKLEAVKEEIPPVISRLTAAQLDAIYPENVIGKPITTRQFLIHLEAHLNYHLGQVDYLRRVITGKSAIDLAPL